MRTDRRGTAMQILLLAAAIAYSGLPWEAVAGFPLDPAGSYLSELAAADQPLGWLFRALDLTTGVLVLIALLVGGRSGGAVARRGATLALAGFAVLTIVDASSPMACASSASLRCARGDAANTLGLAHQIHTVSSAGALAALLVSAVLLAVAVSRDAGWDRPVGRRLLLALVVSIVAVTVLVSVLAVLSTDEGRLMSGGGYAQRAQVLLVSLYLGWFGFLVKRLGSGPVRVTASPTDAVRPR
ncbi:MAG: DUF998 domain-containing protein [Micrococcales bacterium]|nr:DUF998 domain-containing protein [Micrococcales bacterium]